MSAELGGIGRISVPYPIREAILVGNVPGRDAVFNSHEPSFEGAKRNQDSVG